MIEASILVEGLDVDELPDLLHARLRPAARRSLDNRRVIIIEHLPRRFGCSSATVLICGVPDMGCSSLTILRYGGWFHPFGQSERRKLRLLSDILPVVQEVCSAKGWTQDEICFLL